MCSWVVEVRTKAYVPAGLEEWLRSKAVPLNAGVLSVEVKCCALRLGCKSSNLCAAERWEPQESEANETWTPK